MTRVAVVTDISADLDPRAAAANRISVVPVASALAGDRPLAQGESSGLEPSGPFASPACAERRHAEEAFSAAFLLLAETHDAIVAVLPSGRLYGDVAAATAARDRVAAPVAIVDSRSVSLGLGFQVLHAAELAARGVPADDITATLLAARDRYQVVFLVESVAHLRQRGMVGRSAALIAEALQLKPLLRLDEGQFVPYERARTSARAIAELAAFVSELPAVGRCAVLYTTSRRDADRLVRAVAEETGLPPDHLVLQRMGPATAAHVGPGALGVAIEEAEFA